MEWLTIKRSEEAGSRQEGLAWHGKRESQFIEPRSLGNGPSRRNPTAPSLFLRDISDRFSKQPADMRRKT